MFFKAKPKNASTFLSKVLQPAVQRSFSRAAVQALVSADEATHELEQNRDVNPTFNSIDYQKLQSYSKTHLRKKAEENAAEAEWLSQLRSPQ